MSSRLVLRIEDFGSLGTIVLTVRMCFDARSPLAFTIVNAPLGAVVG